jgi:signal transduction histidine kinase
MEQGCELGMKRYFANPELKISSGILLGLMCFFVLLQVIVLKVNSNNLKEDYINSIGAVTARIVEKRPELEKEIIPLITKPISGEEALKAKAVLSQYGVSKELESGLFPYVNKTAARSAHYFFLINLFMAALFFTLNYFQFSFFYKRIRKLTLGAKRVVEGDYAISINENKEGDFSKLAVSFNSMKEVIRNNISQLKSEKQFLADILSDISHQLKTPLSSMIVYNDIMLTKELSREQSRTFLLNNQNQLNRMQWLIQSILKLAKLDAKAIEFHKENQSLNETLQEAVDALESRALNGNVKVIIKEKEDINLNHDRLWLEEAFINIIKNGIEHTQASGEIMIELAENPIYRRVIIEDNGEGIIEEDLPHIFKRFYKAKTSRKSESVGIGLALAKSIVEAHNGVIEVQSKPYEGAKFIVTFLKY